jgi:hypothetical protein
MPHFDRPHQAPITKHQPLPSFALAPCRHSDATPRLRFFNCLVAARSLRATTRYSLFNHSAFTKPLLSRCAHLGTDVFLLVPDREPAVQKGIWSIHGLDFPGLHFSKPGKRREEKRKLVSHCRQLAAPRLVHSGRCMPHANYLGHPANKKLNVNSSLPSAGTPNSIQCSAQPGFCDKKRPLRSTPDQV